MNKSKISKLHDTFIFLLPKLLVLVRQLLASTEKVPRHIPSTERMDGWRNERTNERTNNTASPVPTSIHPPLALSQPEPQCTHTADSSLPLPPKKKARHREIGSIRLVVFISNFAFCPRVSPSCSTKTSKTCKSGLSLFSTRRRPLSDTA